MRTGHSASIAVVLRFIVMKIFKPCLKIKHAARDIYQCLVIFCTYLFYLVSEKVTAKVTLSLENIFVDIFCQLLCTSIISVFTLKKLKTRHTKAVAESANQPKELFI